MMKLTQVNITVNVCVVTNAPEADVREIQAVAGVSGEALAHYIVDVLVSKAYAAEVCMLQPVSPVPVYPVPAGWTLVEV